MTNTLTYKPRTVKTRVSPQECFRYRTGTLPPRQGISLRPADNRPGSQARRHRPVETVNDMVKPAFSGTTTLPDPRQWAAQIARCSLEAVEGQRPLTQLNRWVTPRQYQILEKRRDWFAKGRYPRSARNSSQPREKVRPVSVLSARCRATADGAQEATVVLHDGKRGRASSLRLENKAGRWLVTQLQLG